MITRLFCALAALAGRAAVAQKHVSFPEHGCDEISDCASALGKLCFEKTFGSDNAARVDLDIAYKVANCLRGVGEPSAFDEEHDFVPARVESECLGAGEDGETEVKKRALKAASKYVGCLESPAAQKAVMFDKDGAKVNHGLACRQIPEPKCAAPTESDEDVKREKKCKLALELALGCPARNQGYYYDPAAESVVLALKKADRVHEVMSHCDEDEDRRDACAELASRDRDEMSKIARVHKSYIFRQAQKTIKDFEQKRRRLAEAGEM
jgi:hypothetical protein